MNDLFIDVDYAQIYKDGQKIGGDVFLLSRNPENNQIVCTLSDGLGSGVKANVLASLTARMAHKLSFSPMDLTHSARIIMNTLPVCKERKISYATFTIADLRMLASDQVAMNLVEYDNPSALVFQGSTSVQWNVEHIDLQRDGAFKKEVLGHSLLTLPIGSRLVIFSAGSPRSVWAGRFPWVGAWMGCGSSPVPRSRQTPISPAMISPRPLSVVRTAWTA